QPAARPRLLPLLARLLRRKLPGAAPAGAGAARQDRSGTVAQRARAVDADEPRMARHLGRPLRRGRRGLLPAAVAVRDHAARSVELHPALRTRAPAPRRRRLQSGRHQACLVPDALAGRSAAAQPAATCRTSRPSANPVRAARRAAGCAALSLQLRGDDPAGLGAAPVPARGRSVPRPHGRDRGGLAAGDVMSAGLIGRLLAPIQSSTLGYQIGLIGFARLSNMVRLARYARHVHPRYAPRLLLIGATGLISLPWRVWETMRWGRRIAATPIAGPPIFIVGHWRSGTTHLHSL